MPKSIFKRAFNKNISKPVRGIGKQVKQGVKKQVMRPTKKAMKDYIKKNLL